LKILNFNKQIQSDLEDLFTEEYSDILKLIEEWIYQISKWTLDLYANKEFKEFYDNRNFW